MNYKPDEATLIAFLYDELEGKEKERVQQYLQEHPAEVKKLQELKAVSAIMHSVGDKEVIAPPVFAEHETNSPFWNSTSFKTVLSIAASLLLLVVAGKVLGPEIRYSNGELRVSFGLPRNEQSASEKKAENVTGITPTLTASDVQGMINSSLQSTSRSMETKWSENQQKLNASINASLDRNSKKVDNLITNVSQASSEQLRSYVGSLQAENLRLIKDYFQLSAKEQNAYVEKLMVGFSKYVQEQRTQDMMLVQHKMEDIEKNSDQFKQETEQLLASIISGKPDKKSY
jgi:hypothetical protein